MYPNSLIFPWFKTTSRSCIKELSSYIWRKIIGHSNQGQYFSKTFRIPSYTPMTVLGRQQSAYYSHVPRQTSCRRKSVNIRSWSWSCRGKCCRSTGISCFMFCLSICARFLSPFPSAQLFSCVWSVMARVELELTFLVELTPLLQLHLDAALWLMPWQELEGPSSAGYFVWLQLFFFEGNLTSSLWEEVVSENVSYTFFFSISLGYMNNEEFVFSSRRQQTHFGGKPSPGKFPQPILRVRARRHNACGRHNTRTRPQYKFTLWTIWTNSDNLNGFGQWAASCVSIALRRHRPLNFRGRGHR